MSYALHFVLDNWTKLKEYFFLWAYMPKEYFLERLTLATDEQVKKYGTANKVWGSAKDAKNI